MINKLKIIFAGNSKFALNQINMIYKKTNYKFSYLITTKNFKLVRNKLIENPIKIFSIENKIKLLEINKMNLYFINKIKKINPDIIIVSSYREYFTKKLLEIPKFGCINIHPSLLPKLKGPSPIYWTIINNDKFTGVTLIKMNNKIDCGNILYQKKYKLHNNINYKDLLNKLSNLGGYMIINFLNYLKNNNKFLYIKNKYSNNIPTITRKINKLDSIIDFNQSSDYIDRKVRAFVLWPNMYFMFKDNKIKILKSKCKFIHTYFILYKGKIFIYKKKVFLIFKKGILELIKLNFNGKIINNNIYNMKFFYEKNKKLY